SVLNEGGTSDQRPPRILFSDNETLRDVQEHAALRDLIAAYLYADETRLALGEKADREFLRNYWRISDLLKEYFEYYGKGDKAANQPQDTIVERILDRLKSAES